MFVCVCIFRMLFICKSVLKASSLFSDHLDKDRSGDLGVYTIPHLICKVIVERLKVHDETVLIILSVTRVWVSLGNRYSWVNVMVFTDFGRIQKYA